MKKNEGNVRKMVEKVLIKTHRNTTGNSANIIARIKENKSFVYSYWSRSSGCADI